MLVKERKHLGNIERIDHVLYVGMVLEIQSQQVK